MPHGFSCDEVALFLGVHRNKAPQAFDPAMDKLARALNFNPQRTLAALLERAAELRVLDERERLRPMSPSELQWRADRQQGRGNGRCPG